MSGPEEELLTMSKLTSAIQEIVKRMDQREKNAFEAGRAAMCRGSEFQLESEASYCMKYDTFEKYQESLNADNK